MSTRYRILEEAITGPDSQSVFYPQYSNAWFNGWSYYLGHNPAHFERFDTEREANDFLCRITAERRRNEMYWKQLNQRKKTHAFDKSKCGQTYV